MMHYELLYLVSGAYSDEEVLAIKEKIRVLIEKAGGKITLDDTLGKRKLAYPIKQQHHGTYQLLEFDIDGEPIKKLSNDLQLTDEVLRHTIVKRDLKAPSFRELTRMHEKERVQRAEQERNREATKLADKPGESKKIKIEDLDKKLDELLDSEIL